MSTNNFFYLSDRRKRDGVKCSDLPVTKIIFVRVLPYLTDVKRNIFIFPAQTVNCTNTHTYTKPQQLRSVTYHEAFCSD